MAENNKTGAPFDFELNTPGVPMSTLVMQNNNLARANANAMHKTVYDEEGGARQVAFKRYEDLATEDKTLPGAIDELSAAIGAWKDLKEKILWEGSVLYGGSIPIANPSQYPVLLISIGSVVTVIPQNANGDFVGGYVYTPSGDTPTIIYSRTAYLTISGNSLRVSGVSSMNHFGGSAHGSITTASAITRVSALGV